MRRESVEQGHFVDFIRLRRAERFRQGVERLAAKRIQFRKRQCDIFVYVVLDFFREENRAAAFLQLLFDGFLGQRPCFRRLAKCIPKNGDTVPVTHGDKARRIIYFRRKFKLNRSNRTFFFI